MTDRIEAQLERFAPGFRDRVLARSVMPPAEVERHNENNIGGDHGRGSQTGLALLTPPLPRPDPYANPARDAFPGSPPTPPRGGRARHLRHHPAPPRPQRPFVE